jgi:hypothetical protein
MLSLILAVIALAGVVATALVGRSRLTAQRNTLDAHAGRLNNVRALPQEVSYARKELAAAKEQLALSREHADSEAAKHTQSITDQRPAADARFTAADTDAVHAAHRLTELEQYVRRSLDHLAAAEPRSRVIRGSLFARQCAVLDLLPELQEELLAELGASVLYRYADGPNGWRMYLRWPGNAPAADIKLGALMMAISPAASAADEERGTTQLRSLLGAMREGGPALLQVGPLVVHQGEQRMFAGYMPDRWPGPGEVHQDAAIKGVDTDLLQSMDARDVVELTDWRFSP